MILTYLYDLSELNKMGDGIVLGIKNYSFSLPKLFGKEEILSIKKSTDKKIFLSITPLYHENELEGIKDIICYLKDLDGFIFQDLGLIEIFNEFNILNKAIYAPETFMTNSIDKEFFDGSINQFMLSREITKDDIEMILKNKKNTKYMYQSFGHQMLFYSYRPHFSNFKSFYNLDEDFRNKFNIKIKEETRTETYNTIEDERGFRIYKGEIFNGYSELINLEFDYHVLDRIFIDDEMYFDTISLFKGELNLDEYFDKYKNKNLSNGYLFHETGMLKSGKR